MTPEAIPALCLAAVCAALMTAAAAFAHEAPVYLLVFDAPDVSVTVAAYDTEDDCADVAYTLQRFTTVASYSCEIEK
jgi:hypothetical protein